MLRLASIKLGTSEVSARDSLWSAIVRIALDVEGASNFTVDTTIPPGRDAAGVASDGEAFAAIGLCVDDSEGLMRPIRGAEAALRCLATRALRVDLYADQAWVAGVSDWGDEMDVLFGESAWDAFELAIRDSYPAAVVEEAEALSRPLFSGTGGLDGEPPRG